MLLFCVATLSCDRSPPYHPKPATVAGKGVIVGVVRFSGSPPLMREIPNSSCRPGGDPVKEEWAVIDAEGHLANVVVYLKDGPNVDVPLEPAVLDQAGCRYTPHVVAVRTGQVLRVTTSDTVPHNVHGEPPANRAFNVGMTGPGQSHDFKFDRPDTFRVRCDVHPWMGAWVAVFDHSLFAVTGEGGTFTIPNVPPGTYTLVAWHERYGKVEQQVTVPPDAGTETPVRAEITFGK